MVMGVLRNLNYFKGWHRTTPSVHQHPPDQRKTKIGRNSRRSVCVCVSACVRCKFCQWMLWWNVSCHLDGVHYRMPNNKKNIFDERENWKSPVTQTANCNIVYLSRAEIAAAIRSTFSFFSPTLSHFLDIIFRRRRRCCFFFYTSSHRRHLSQCWLFICCHSLYISFMALSAHMSPSWVECLALTYIVHVMLGIATKRMKNDDDDDDKASTAIHE